MKRLKIVVLDSGIDINCVSLIKNHIYPLEVIEEKGFYKIVNSIICEDQHGSMIIQEILGEEEQQNLELYSIKILDDMLRCDLGKLVFALKFI